MPKNVILHIDGASKGNPGPSSVGVVIRSEEKKLLKTLSEPIGNTTNNVAEYFAMIYGLQEALHMQATGVTVYTDSQLLARQYSGEYKAKEPHVILLRRLVRHLAKYFKHCEVHHIPREENKEADRLANQAADELI